MSTTGRMSLPSLREAESSLLARRRAQRGTPTLGDDADHALLRALAGLSSGTERVAHEVGLRVGRDVYARRFFEDTLPGAIVVLSTSLFASGAGTITLESSFHRSARLHFTPAHALAGADRAIVLAFVAGTVEGFFGAAFNCEAQAHATDEGLLALELGEGRDVNRKGAAA